MAKRTIQQIEALIEKSQTVIRIEKLKLEALQQEFIEATMAECPKSTTLHNFGDMNIKAAKEAIDLNFLRPAQRSLFSPQEITQEDIENSYSMSKIIPPDILSNV